jgi:putative peptidoglycan lipid II flippase
VTGAALARAGLTVTAAYLLSRVLGWVRVVVLGNVFGAGAELDAFYAAFRIPDLIFQLVAAGALASALVPVLSSLLAQGEDHRAWRVASTVANAVVVAAVVLAAVMAVLAPVIVPAIVPGFDAATTERTVELTRLMLLSPVFLAAGAVATAMLNSEGRFAAAALAPLIYNAAIIAGALLLGPSMGVMGAALGVVAGSVAHLVIQLPPLRGRLAVVLDLGDAAARKAFALMGPRAIGLGASQITFVVNTTLATGLGVGAVVAYNVAFNVLQIPLGVIGLPLGIVLLPSLSRALAQGMQAEFARLVGGALRLLLWATLFITAVGVSARLETVTLLFGWGFDEAALVATAATLGVFLLGLPAHSMNVILARAFYSGHDTATPVGVAILSVVVNVSISLATVEVLGLSGLALGIALGAWFETTVLLVLLRRRGLGFEVGPVARTAAVAAAGAAIAGLLSAGVLAIPVSLPGLPASLVLLSRLVVATAAAGAGYLLYSRLVGLPELPRTLALVRSALPRR